MVKVYLALQCYFNYCDEFETVVCVFDCEVKALLWKEEVAPTETEWREYREFELK
jgi:hypothetical protein